MTTRTTHDRPKDEANGHPPLLRDGDRMSAEEFERRYDAMPDLKKAELINGVVYMGSPVRLDDHGEPHVHLSLWLATYKVATPGLRAGDNSTARLEGDNRPQPDLVLMIARGGQASVSADGYVEGGPELVAEVSASSVRLDTGGKLEMYRDNGVREYIVWRVLDRRVEWFVLRDGRYDPLQPDEGGVFRSEVFPGLWLDAAALVRDDMPAVIAVLQRGLASPDHSAFVARLRGS
jgi:Uma2 family endonuclease